MAKATSLVLILCVFLAACRRETTTISEPAHVQPTESMIERHNEGVAFMGQFDFGRAHDVFAELSQEHPDWARVAVDLSIATLNRQLPDDDKAAAELLDDVIKSEPDNLRALYCRAILYFNSGKPNLALPKFQRVAVADPQDAYAVYFTGQCLFVLGRYEEALEAFRNAREIDPYLRSAYYGAFKAASQLRKADEAADELQTFQRLDRNPQAQLAEIKYTRMGTKALVTALEPQSETSRSLPTGRVFAPAEALKLTGADGVQWSKRSPGVHPNLTVCDIDGDSRLDLFVAGGIEGQDHENAVLIATEQGFRLAEDHPLSRMHDVNTALWADFDNDGLTDVYLCRNGPNQLWRQSPSRTWRDVTSTTLTAGGLANTVDGLAVDADHDGDLDLVLANSDAPNELFSNNLDGTFRPLGADQSIDGGDRSSRQVVASDLDNDRDLDLVVINDEAPHDVYLNDRLWSYRPAEGFSAFTASDIQSCVAADRDADGQVELYTVTSGRLVAWTRDDAGQWTAGAVAGTPSELNVDDRSSALDVLDVNGTGRDDFLLTKDGGWIAVMGADALETFFRPEDDVEHIAVVQRDVARGPSVVGLRSGMPPVVCRPGNGRFPFLSVALTGREDVGQQMRSNASGIGVKGAVRVGSRWSLFHTLRTSSGPGQSLQPLAVGLGGQSHCDFMRLHWPDGLIQTEGRLATGELHRVQETQRQTSSCPVVFAWDGTEYRFISDLLGVGGLGFNLGRGEYAEPRPWENLLLPIGSLESRRDRYEVKIGEPMEEICYLDAVDLVQYDLPPGWEMTLDERSAVSHPIPTGAPVYYRHSMRVARAVNDQGDDVTRAVAEVDGQAARVGGLDPRFIGITQPYVLTLTFKQPLNDVPGGTPVLVFDGWIEYPYSQTMFAAWQAGVGFEAPTLQARESGGPWRTVWSQFGFMAGMPRQSSVPLPIEKLPPKTTQLRLLSNVEIYWDRLVVVAQEDCPEARRTRLPLMEARLHEPGFAERTTFAQRRPHYDYRKRAPLWDTRHAAGYYTSFGNVRPLVSSMDAAVAIFGPGEEIHLEFETDRRPLTSDWTRRFVIESHGWCKDMDLYTRDGETVEPLPRRDSESMSDTEQRRQLHLKFNQRYRSG